MSRKFKLYEIPQSLIQGNKFLKWMESNSNDKTGPICVTLKVDENGFILYWRDLNKKSDYLDIAHIRDVRIGKYANVPKDKNYRDVLSSGQSNFSIEDKTISIYYGSDFVNVQCINFVSLAYDANKVVKEWSQHIFECSLSPRTQNLSSWEHLNKLRTILLYGKSVIDEKTKEFRLPVQTIVDLFATTEKQHIESEKQHVHHMLQSVGLPSGKNDYLDEKTLTQEKFFQFFLRLVSKEDIEKIFAEYGTKKKLCMNPDQFQNFFNEKQRDPRLNELLYPYYTLEKSCEMIMKFETDESFRKKKQLSPQGLIRYLMDVENEVIDPAKYELSEDMEQPLCHYFISSSHNTYLSGHQVTGKTEAEMYRQVLLSGCRCIELDCWDDRNLDEPIITHGLTLCTQILFKDAIEAIKECAFKTSPYPVLLSFENHCSKSMQAKMAKYLVDCFGESLLIDPLSQYPLKPGVKLPSPEDLKFKILIKNKKSDEKERTGSRICSIKSFDQTTLDENNFNIITQENNTQSIASAVKDSISTSNSENSLAFNNSVDFTKIIQKRINSSINNECYNYENNNADLTKNLKIEQNECNSDESGSEDEKPNMNSPDKNITAKEMSRLVNYLQPVDFQSFEISEKRNKSYELSSFLETKAYNLHKEKSTEFVNYNKRQFSRIYPKSTRIASDNFMPQVYWNVGCQLVALNFQTLDVGMRLNLGKFEYNNRSGFVLKPEVMRRVDINKPFDPFSESSIDGIVPATVNVQVISGIYFNDKRERSMGYTVLVEMFGLPADTIKGQRACRAKMVSSNTFNVVYNDTVFNFKKIIMPQIALICFSAFDEQNRLVGQRVLPVTALRSGYRYICLKNESNQPLNMCMLFVNITVKDYVPNKFAELADALVDPIRYISNLEKREEMLKSLQDDFETQNENEITKKQESTNIVDNNNNNNNNPLNHSNSLNGINISNQTNQNVNNLSTGSHSYNERLSISNERPNYFIGVTPFQQQFEIKRKSQYDISHTLGTNPSLFADIDIDELKKNKNFLAILKIYNKKIKKYEKEAEKKVSETIQSFQTENDKMINEFHRSKHKIEKEITKSEKIATKRNSLVVNEDIKLNYKNQIDAIDNDLATNVQILEQKLIREVQNIYIEMYKQIKIVQVASLDPLYMKLEKCVLEIQEQRMQSLKMISDKEINEVNKQVHQDIKLRKKLALKNAIDKEEIQRLSREIEKESVSSAVNENAKMRELLKIKQKLLKNLIEKSLNSLREQKEKQKLLYENEFVNNCQIRKEKVEEEYRRIVNVRRKTSLPNNIKINISKENNSSCTSKGDYSNDNTIF